MSTKRRRPTVGKLSAALKSEDLRRRTAASRYLAGLLRRRPFVSKIEQAIVDAGALSSVLEELGLLKHADALERLAKKHGIEPDVSAADAYAIIERAEMKATLERSTTNTNSASLPRRPRIPASIEDELDELCKTMPRPDSIKKLAARYKVDPDSINTALRRRRKPT